jgi:hypothetical protein
VVQASGVFRPGGSDRLSDWRRGGGSCRLATGFVQFENSIEAERRVADVSWQVGEWRRERRGKRSDAQMGQERDLKNDGAGERSAMDCEIEGIGLEIWI